MQILAEALMLSLTMKVRWLLLLLLLSHCAIFLRWDGEKKVWEESDGFNAKQSRFM